MVKFKFLPIVVTGLLLGCASSQPGAVENGSGALTVEPAKLVIGGALTVKMQAALRPPNTEIEPPDGEYLIQIEALDIETNWSFGSAEGPRTTYKRAEVPERADIGTLFVKNGIGQATFALKSDYGNVKLAPGKGLFIYAKGEKWGEGLAVTIDSN